MRAFAVLGLVAAAQGSNLLYPKGCSDASKANYWPDNPDSEAACLPQATVYCPDPLADNYDAASRKLRPRTSRLPCPPCQPPLPSPARRASAHRLLAHWLVHTRARQTPALQQAPPAPPPPPVPLPPPPPEPPAPQSDSRASPKPPCNNQRRPSSQSRMPLSCVAASWSDSTNSAYKPYAVALAAFCTYNVYGCTDPLAANYQSVVPTAAGNQWAVNSEMCQYAGCNDTDARNFDSQVSGPHSAPALPSCSGRQGPHVKRQAPSRVAPRVRIHHWGEFGPAGRGGICMPGWRLAAGRARVLTPHARKWQATFNDGTCDYGIVGCTVRKCLCPVHPTRAGGGGRGQGSPAAAAVTLVTPAV